MTTRFLLLLFSENSRAQPKCFWARCDFFFFFSASSIQEEPRFVTAPECIRKAWNEFTYCEQFNRGELLKIFRSLEPKEGMDGLLAEYLQEKSEKMILEMKFRHQEASTK